MVHTAKISSHLCSIHGVHSQNILSFMFNPWCAQPKYPAICIKSEAHRATDLQILSLTLNPWGTVRCLSSMGASRDSSDLGNGCRVVSELRRITLSPVPVFCSHTTHRSSALHNMHSSTKHHSLALDSLHSSTKHHSSTLHNMHSSAKCYSSAFHDMHSNSLAASITA